MSTAEATDQQVLSEPYVLECYAGTISDIVDWADWTTSELNNITIKAAAGEEHKGVIGAGFIMEQPTGTILQTTNNWIVIQDITVRVEPNVNSICYKIVGTDSLVQRCIAIVNNQTGGTVTGFITSGQRTVIRNCLGYRSNITSSGNCYLFNNNSNSASIYSCTAVQGENNVYSNSVNIGRVFNNIVSFDAFASDYTSNVISSGSSYLASSDLTATAPHSFTGVVDADFEDFAGLNFAPAAGGQLDPANNPGEDQSLLYTDDIAGNTRTVPWTLGAYAIPSAAAFADSDAFTVTISAGGETYTGSGTAALTANLGATGIGAFADLETYTGSGTAALTANLGATGIGTFVDLETYTGSGTAALTANLGASGTGTYEFLGVPIEFNGSLLDQSLYIGFSYSYQLGQFFTGSFTPFTYSLAPTSGVLPPGITLNATTGEVSGVPTGAPASYTNVIIQGEDTNTNTAVTSPPITMEVFAQPEEAGGMFAGTNPITSIFVGETPVQQVFVGEILVWPSIPEPLGEQVYPNSGTFSWACPPGVTTISVVAIGGGGSFPSGVTNANGSGGGGLGWKNNISVTPGQSYDIQVGSGSGGTAGETWFKSAGGTILVQGSHGSRETGGGFIGDGGGNGGNGGLDGGGSGWFWGGGGGAAGGYTANGANGGGDGQVGFDGNGGSGGGGGGGGTGFNTHTAGGGGGGTGLYGTGTNGAGGAAGTGVGNGGLGGFGSDDNSGNNYGGGNGRDVNNLTFGYPGGLRIIWGGGSSYPDNAGTPS